MNPARKRFQKQYGVAADAIAALDIHQIDREKVASALVGAFDGRPDFEADLFWLLAADPLVPCAGPGDGPCPDDRRIRIAMHNSSAEDGRSAAWRTRPPRVRCGPCGSRFRVKAFGDYATPEQIRRAKAIADEVGADHALSWRVTDNIMRTTISGVEYLIDAGGTVLDPAQT